MGSSLDPTVRERLSRALRPDFTRTVQARRVAAGLLVVIAAMLALRPDPAGVHAAVVVAAADLKPGTALEPEHLRLERRARTSLPDGAQEDIGILLGATLAGPVRRGEVLTDVRVLGSRLAELSVGPNARVVPLRLADDAVLDVIRPGDVVDVLGVPGTAFGDVSQDRPRMLAASAVVVLVSPQPSAGEDRVVLVALPAGGATSLAGASLAHTITLAIH